MRNRRKYDLFLGLPRQQKWIRMASTNELPVEKLEAMAEKTNATYRIQKDCSVLVFAEEQSIRDFVKRITLEHKTKPEK